ncbi:lysophospholipid acyltransferase family protein [Clostridium saccharoperbutylacetonicum]
MLRTLLFYSGMILSLVFASIFRIRIKFLTFTNNIKGRNNFIHKVTHTWAKFILKIAGAKVNVIGLENIPKDETVLFVSNHESNFDIPLLLGAIDVPKGFIAKKELENWPFISTWMKYINCIFMDRDNLRKSAEAIVDGINLLKSGHSMVIFPSGTRSKGKSIDEFKSGSFKLATKSKCPIVPLTINGTYKLLEENNNRIKGADIELIIHPTIYVDKLTKDELEKLPNTVHSIIINSCKDY